MITPPLHAGKIIMAVEELYPAALDSFENCGIEIGLNLIIPISGARNFELEIIETINQFV